MRTCSSWKLTAVALGLAIAQFSLSSDAGDIQPTWEALTGKQFRFSWKTERGSGFNGIATLRPGGMITGIGSPNETFWLIDGDGHLIFKHRDGRVSTIFTRAERRDGKWFLSGPFQFRQGVDHVLEETTASPAPTPPAGPKPTINDLIRGYSSQQIVRLDVDETYTFKLKNGAARVIRLTSVQEHRDSITKLIRRATVRIEVDGQPLDLVCAPCAVPTEIGGLRVQADTTTGWTHMPKRVQFSLWDASDPIVNTTRFRFPIRNYRLFSHGVQAFNEPIHLGWGDGDPGGNPRYHNYGFDLAGYEGGEEIVSAIEGEVTKVVPREGVCVQDARGFVCAYWHLNSIEPEIVVGALVRRGQKLGTLGKTGPSGNFSHLHLGPGELRNYLNLYPWLVAAYQAERSKALLAVARPHHMVLTGEKELFDGSNSLAFGGRKIVEWRWVFHDGETVRQAKAEKVFDKPGAYVATLWVKDDRGTQDVDFCQIKVFSAPAPERAMPHIFMTATPTENLRPGQPVRFRFWFQGRGGGPMMVDFGDGARLDDYRSYTELTHCFRTPGIHIVTAHCEADNKPITNKLKVVVQPDAESAR